MRMKRQSALKKKSTRGFRSYPIAIVMFYGPTDRRATKVGVGIIAFEGAEEEPLRRWWSEDTEVRHSRAISDAIVALIEAHAAKWGVMERITGCPHEEGQDYPEGQVCPACPFWTHRDRWSGESLS